MNTKINQTFAKTNSLNKQEHQDLLDYLEKHGPTRIWLYIQHLFNKGQYETCQKLAIENNLEYFRTRQDMPQLSIESKT